MNSEQGKKYFCIQIHTERLHDDNVWRQVQKTLDYFLKNKITATWFSINPTFVGYQAMRFDEGKWKERLKIIASSGQEIQQHTHFYKGVAGKPKGDGYDMSREHMEKRLVEDRQWLENQGFSPIGFVSGAWKVNDDLFQLLADLGYIYDSSSKGVTLSSRNGVLEIPVSGKVRQLVKNILRLNISRNFLDVDNTKVCVVSFHDYDLESLFFRSAFKGVVTVFRTMGFGFVDTGSLYKYLKALN